MYHFAKEKRSSLKQLGISKNDFVIVTGGKLEKPKNTIMLMQAYTKLSESYSNLRLLLFGTVSSDIKNEFDKQMIIDKSIVYVGWVPSKDTYKYFFSADLACFPGTHSTLWEESVGYGLPAIFKLWKGITQIDLGGNCTLLEEPITPESIASAISDLYCNKKKYSEMKQYAETNGVSMFSYSRIAEYCINNEYGKTSNEENHNGGGYKYLIIDICASTICDYSLAA